MSTASRFTYVVPVHNQERVLPNTLPPLAERLRQFPGSDIVLVENGSTDRSMAVCVEVAAQLQSAEVRVRVVSSARGLGHALRRGMQLAGGDVIVLTAADLPFGFSDLEAYLALPARPSLAIGSKAHPESDVAAPALRRLMSIGFRALRIALVGLHVGDSQGTVFIDSSLARRLLPHLRTGDFLFTTELICWATRYGVEPVELPVTYVAQGSSTVSPVRDSVRMARGLFGVRRRLRHTEARAAKAVNA